MFKRTYCIKQSQFCLKSNNFHVFQTFPMENSQADNDSTNTLGNFHLDSQIGQFQDAQPNCMFCCYSFQPMKNVLLTMYGQTLSLTTRSPQSCCFFPFKSNQFTITTTKKILIGKIRSPPYFCLSPSYQLLEVFNAQNKLIYKIIGNCCQLGNWIPSFLRCSCGEVVKYEIYDEQVNQVVGKIENIYNGFCLQLLSFSNNYNIQLPKKSEDKKKILLMNAVIFINLLKYQMI